MQWYQYMVTSSPAESGFSLIELMITVALIAILALIGTSLTGLWSKQAELDKATMSLQSAISLARSTALRNEYPLDTGYMTSQLCFNKLQPELSVHKATETDSASCLTPVVFTYKLSETIKIKSDSDSSDFLCIPFDNFGQISKNSGVCQTKLSLTISNGVLDETITFD